MDLQGVPRDVVVPFDREIVAEGMWGAVPMRLAGLFMRGAFRTQSLRHMQDFTAFAERGADVRGAEG